MNNDPKKMAEELVEAAYTLVASLDPYKQTKFHARAERLEREAAALRDEIKAS